MRDPEKLKENRRRQLARDNKLRRAEDPVYRAKYRARKRASMAAWREKNPDKVADQQSREIRINNIYLGVVPKITMEDIDGAINRSRNS